MDFKDEAAMAWGLGTDKKIWQSELSSDLEPVFPCHHYYRLLFMLGSGMFGFARAGLRVDVKQQLWLCQSLLALPFAPC